MSFISDELAARNLPALGFEQNPEQCRQRREAILDILSDHIYGRTPDFTSTVSATVTYKNEKCFGGHGKHYHYAITATTPGGDFTFPLVLTLPKTDKPVPLVISIGFNPATPSGYTPDEEIVSRGVALAKLHYTDITDDRYDDFQTGIAPLFERSAGKTNLWGKIGMWAWAASRSLDFLETLGCFDPEKIAVEGHSRLGKTALWCGAKDTRFTYVFSNNAGCSGDAVTRKKRGETVADITKNFAYWFCDKYRDYCGDAAEMMPFDQHFLLACIAPRKVAVGASSLDIWADPESEYLCCKAASPAWDAYHQPGFIAPDDRYPVVGDAFGGGIGFHLREGEHSICRADWMRYIDFMLGV